MSSSSLVEAPRGIPWAEVLPQREQKLANLRQEEEELQRLISRTNLEEAKGALQSVLASKVARRKGEEKAVAALKAGYDPMTSAVGGTWATGLLLEKNPLPWIVRQTARFLVPLGVLGLFLGAGGSMLFNAEFAYARLSSGGIIASGILLMVFVLWANSFSNSALRKVGLPTTEEALFLTKDRVPSQAWSAFVKAQESGLFDSIQVLAPRKVFSRVRVGDPFIFGEITATGDLFLIAQFNLGEDLKHLGVAASS